MLSAHTRGLAINSGYGMACVPLKGVRRTIVGVGASGSPQVRWLRNLSQTIGEPPIQSPASTEA